jgi:hypothetical protein
LANFALVKADDSFSVYDRNRCALESQIEELFERSLIRSHIFLDKNDTFLR